MANNEKKTAAERAQKRLMEQGRTGLTRGGQQDLMLRGQERGLAAKSPLSVSSMERGRAGAQVREQHARIYPGKNPFGAERSPDVGLESELRQRQSGQPLAASAVPSTAPAGAKGITARPAGAEGITVSPAPASAAASLTGKYATGDPLGTSGFTATESRSGGKPLTRYEDGKGGFMEATGTRKGGGTVSVMSGPGSNDFTKEEWGKMSGKERTQANVDSYKAQTQAIRDSMAGPRQAGTASGGALTGQQSPFERRKTLREYGMATSELKNDLRRGRISAKKGKVIAATLMDHYDKVLGGDLQKLMQEETRQGGQLMEAQERSAGLLDVAEERERGAAERTGMPGPEEFSWQKSGQDPKTLQDLYTYAGNQGSSGAGAKPVHNIDMSVEGGRAFVMAAKGNPEVFEERKQRFIAQHGEENWRE